MGRGREEEPLVVASGCQLRHEFCRLILSYRHLRLVAFSALPPLALIFLTTILSLDFLDRHRDSLFWPFPAFTLLMAYQFFAKAHQAKRPSSASPPLPQHSSSPPSRSAAGNPPKFPPPRMSAPAAPPAINVTAKIKPPSAKDPSFQPPAYPHPVQPGYSTPHEHVTIEPVSTAHIPSLSRITGLLLPIRYPNSFYTATVTDPVIASVSRVAIYHDHPVAAALSSASAQTPTAGTDKVIGGIRCRLERLDPGAVEALSQDIGHQPTNLYIQTLHLLSPYRGCGVAASLLNSLLFSSSPNPASGFSTSCEVSDLVKHYNIRSVTAHVHEANEDGLKWYISRGFQVQDGVFENYYRRLKPSGARLVKLEPQRCRSGDKPATGTVPKPSQDQARRDETDTPDAEDDWEKVEAEDELEPEELGVHSVTESALLDGYESASRKRKADEEPQRH